MGSAMQGGDIALQYGVANAYNAGLKEGSCRGLRDVMPTMR